MAGDELLIRQFPISPTSVPAPPPSLKLQNMKTRKSACSGINLSQQPWVRHAAEAVAVWNVVRRTKSCFVRRRRQTWITQWRCQWFMERCLLIMLCLLDLLHWCVVQEKWGCCKENYYNHQTARQKRKRMKGEMMMGVGSMVEMNSCLHLIGYNVPNTLRLILLILIIMFLTSILFIILETNVRLMTGDLSVLSLLVWT